jgi:ubiquinol-cytochrome c reductase cytochrome c1 subunit
MLKSLAIDMRLSRILPGTLALTAALMLAAPAPVSAAETPPRQSWSWSGPFGLFDRAQLQRGYKVYREACAACHGMELLAFRNLSEPGGPEFSEAAVQVIAAEHHIVDGPDEFGDMFERPGVASDRFPSPFPNEQAARAANNGAYPPDLSVMAKAREGGTNYLYALLTGYQDPPPGVEMRAGMYYNPYFHGEQIAMPQPFSDGQIAYDDGTPETIENYARDVTAFMMWAAEPKMEARKRIGFQVMIYLVVFAGLLYFSKRKLWREVEH